MVQSITIPAVIKQLQSLKPHKASGPDEIPLWFLRDYAVDIGPMSAVNYQTGNIYVWCVQEWGKSDPANYTPISLTCLSSKVLEHNITHSHVMTHLEQYTILTDVHHGFRAKQSTVTQLILTIHDMAKPFKTTSLFLLQYWTLVKPSTRFPTDAILTSHNIIAFVDPYLVGLNHS